MLATSLFASVALNPSSANGLFYGNPALLGIQAFAVVVVAAFSFAGSYVLLRVINLVTPIRVTPEEEEAGLDLTQHGEEAYA